MFNCTTCLTLQQYIRVLNFRGREELPDHLDFFRKNQLSSIINIQYKDYLLFGCFEFNHPRSHPIQEFHFSKILNPNPIKI